MKSKITIYRLPFGSCRVEDRENWHNTRVEGMTYISSFEGEAAAEECYHLTNAPSELLSEEQQSILNEQHFKGPSLSVGDIVRVQPLTNHNQYFLCKSFGWEKYEGNVIELLKNLQW